MKIVIPAYEPDEKLISLIYNIREYSDYEIVIVDDGSSIKCKNIFEKARELGCTVLTHNVNQGKGAALKTAFSYCIRDNEKEGVVCADCDGQHIWQDIKRIADAVFEHKNSIILGSREFVGKVPIKSLIGNKITTSIFRLISGNEIHDTQTGLRGFSANMLPWLVRLKGNRYEFEMNQLLEAKAAGFQLYSINIETIYENNNASSHFKPIRDSIRIYLPIFKFVFSSSICGIIDFSLLFLINALTSNLLISVILTRIISSLCNYFINKNIVFNSKKQAHQTTFFKYYGLVIIIMLCNYLLLRFFTNYTAFSLLFSKIITEFVLFLFSYIIQHKFIFGINAVL